jgi:hypothetical protein
MTSRADSDSGVLAQTVDEAAGWGVEVQEANRLGPRVAESVGRVARGGDEGSWAGPSRLVSDEELDRSLEYVEGVGVVLVSVRVDALEGRQERHVDRGQLRQVADDSQRARLVPDYLSRVRVGEDGVRERPAPVGRRLVLVEARILATADLVTEAAGRGVEVEKGGGRATRVAEGVDDVGRRRGESTRWRADRLPLRAEPQLELALEDVERVRVVVVNVRVRALFAGLVAEPGHDQVVEVGQDAKGALRPVGDDLALPGR